jgi:hypothetical protein
MPMTRPNALHREGGSVTSPVIVAVAGILALTLAAVAWLALNPPPRAAAVAPVAPGASAPAPSPVITPSPSAAALPARVQDGNARVRLRYAWLVASDYARDHGSFTGLSPIYAKHRLHATAGDVQLTGEGPLVLTTRFDRSGKSATGVVSIRVASGRDLLLVTRSTTGHTFCFVQRGAETGGGVGDVNRVDQCAIRWG